MSYYSRAQSLFDDEYRRDLAPTEPRIEDYIYSAEPRTAPRADGPHDDRPLSAAAPTASAPVKEGPGKAENAQNASAQDPAEYEGGHTAQQVRTAAVAVLSSVLAGDDSNTGEMADYLRRNCPEDLGPFEAALKMCYEQRQMTERRCAAAAPAAPGEEESGAEVVVPAEEPTEPEPPDTANACTPNEDETTLLTALTTSAPSASSLQAQPGPSASRLQAQPGPGTEDGLPPFSTAARFLTRKAKPPEELIEGILRRGHKMLLSGPSKAGKSFMLMELCIAITEGLPWLGFQCRRGRVLYINLEIDDESCHQRIENIYEAMDIMPEYAEYITVWNLRGHALPLDELVPLLLERLQRQHVIGMPYNAIIIDPIYKVITGDENSASDMGAFCNQFDRLCDATGASVIYCHHHSKGAQGAKRSIDRASGSGVFARDPDAVLDMIQLELTDRQKSELPPGTTAWRMESNLREFRNITPVNMTFQWPLHIVDHSSALQNAPAEGSFQSYQLRSGKATREEWREKIMQAYAELAKEGIVTVSAMAVKLGVAYNTVRAHLTDCEDVLQMEHGRLFPAAPNKTPVILPGSMRVG